MKNNRNVYINRHNYLDKITIEFDSLLDGQKAITIISGNAGTGKTFLFRNLMPFFYNNNATVISCKSMQHNRASVAGISKVINDIVTKILLLPKSSYDKVVKVYTNTLNKDLAHIIAASSNARKIFPHLQQNANYPTDTKIANDSLVKFLKISSNIFYPMILHFDDLHWCDALTIDIINSIIDDDNIKIYLVLSYRTKEMLVDKLNLGEYKFANIEVREFTYEETKEYLSAYSQDMNLNFTEITKEIHLLTGGNPFYIISLVDELSKKQGTTNDIAKIKNVNIQFNIEHILKDKLRCLNEFQVEIVNTIACLGGEVSLEILSNSIKKDNIIDILEEIIEIGILTRKDNNISIIHDIIHNYIYINISNEYKNNFIKQLINNLLVIKENLEISRAIVSLCMQLENDDLLSIDRLIIPHIHKVAEIKKNMTAFEQGLELFRLCVTILNEYEMDDYWAEIQIDYMECLYISNNMIEAQKKYKFIKNVVDENMMIKLKMRYLKCFASSAHWEMVLKLGEDILNAYGHSLNKFYVPFGLLSFRNNYRQGNFKRLLNRDNLCDGKTLDVLYVLLSMFPAANRIDEGVFTKIVLKLSLITAKYSKTEYSGIGYACGVYVLYHVFNDYETGNRLQKETLTLLKQSKDNKAIAYSLIGTFTYHISNSFYNTNKVLEKAIQSGNIEQEYTYSNYAIIFSIITQYVKGTNLNKLKEYINIVQKKTARTDNYLTKYMCYIHLANIELLSNGHGGEVEIPRDRQAFHDTVCLNYDMLQVHRLFIEGEIRKAYILAKGIEDKVDMYKGFILNDDFYFYSALARINIYNTLDKRQRNKNHKIINKHLRTYNKYAKENNNSHKAKSLLLNAEYMDKINGKQSSEKDYYRAMEFANGDKNIQLSALANLLAAQKQSYNLKAAKFYAHEAAELYRLWGAEYIAKKIENQFNLMQSIADDEVNPEDKETNVSNYVKMLNTASESDIVDMLFTSLFKINNVIRCTLLFEEDNSYYIYYDKYRDKGYRIKNRKVNINYDSNIHQGIIRYVFRTQQTLKVINEEQNIFLHDDYMQNNDITIFSTPLFINDIMMACMYIELLTNEDNEQIQEIITTFAPNILSRRLINETLKDDRKLAQSTPLTKRELEIAKLIIEGYSNKEISKKVFISEGTARNHISNIYYKLNVKSRVQAVIKLKEMGY